MPVEASRPVPAGRARPAVLAARIGLLYAAGAGLYIVASTRLALWLASSSAALARVEELKGVAFVLTTAFLVFMLLWGLLSHREQLEVEVARQREALSCAERRAVSGTMAATVAHDINNLLSVLSLATDEFTSDDRLLPDQREIASRAQEATHRLADLVIRLRHLARPDTGPRAPADLVQLARGAVDLLAHHGRVREAQLRLTAPPSLPASLHPTLVQQILWNLVLNAADVAERVEVVIATDDPYALVEVHDDGPGMTDAEITRALGGLYTTKAHGTGLGLLSVQQAAQAHDGSVEIARSGRLGGTCVRVRLKREG